MIICNKKKKEIKKKTNLEFTAKHIFEVQTKII